LPLPDSLYVLTDSSNACTKSNELQPWSAKRDDAGGPRVVMWCLESELVMLGLQEVHRRSSGSFQRSNGLAVDFLHRIQSTEILGTQVILCSFRIAFVGSSGVPCYER